MIRDIAIIGTGPAAGSAALQLANAGLDTVILERRRLPRHKPCGGLVPAGIVHSLNLGSTLDALVEHRVGSILNLNNFESPYCQTRPQEDLLLVNRARFDQGLIDLAITRSKGRIELLQDFSVTQVTEFPEFVEIRDRAGHSIKSRVLIAADGAASQTARCLGLNPGRKNAVSMDCELKVDLKKYRKEAKHLTFNFFCLPVGYGWIFAKSESVLSCGVASWGINTGIQDYLDNFISNCFVRDELLERHDFGFPIPVWDGVKPIATRRCALAGDAASLVDPVIGEGISYALASGYFAAETAIEILSNQDIGHRGMAHYQAKVEQHMVPGLEFKRKFLSLAYSRAPDYFYRQITTSQTAYS